MDELKMHPTVKPIALIADDSPAEWSRQYQMLGLTSPYSE
jgi:hypothetical protein